MQAMHVLSPDYGVWNVSIHSAENGEVVLLSHQPSVLLDSRDDIKYPAQVAVNYPENQDLNVLKGKRKEKDQKDT